MTVHPSSRTYQYNIYYIISVKSQTSHAGCPWFYAMERYNNLNRGIDRQSHKNLKGHRDRVSHHHRWKMPASNFRICMFRGFDRAACNIYFSSSVWKEISLKTTQTHLHLAKFNMTQGKTITVVQMEAFIDVSNRYIFERNYLLQTTCSKDKGELAVNFYCC